MRQNIKKVEQVTLIGLNVQFLAHGVKQLCVLINHLDHRVHVARKLAHIDFTLDEVLSCGHVTALLVEVLGGTFVRDGCLVRLLRFN